MITLATISRLRASQPSARVSPTITGDTRSATVVAKTDVECYRLEGKAFQGLMLKRPEIAAREMLEAIAGALPDRQLKNGQAVTAGEGAL